MINFCLNHHSMPHRTKRNSLAVKREHDDISSVSGALIHTHPPNAVILMYYALEWNI